MLRDDPISWEATEIQRVEADKLSASGVEVQPLRMCSSGLVLFEEVSRASEPSGVLRRQSKLDGQERSSYDFREAAGGTCLARMSRFAIAGGGKRNHPE